MLASYIASRVFVSNDDTVFSEVNNWLLSNGISMEDITPYMSLAYNASILTGFQLEQLCKDYERIESFYNAVVCNTAELLEAFNIEKDPVKVFSLYVYLYRSGYLSVNHEFKYSNDMKDLPLLNGVDVVRGKGVCRSISYMFTDVCNSVGLTASNVSVRVKPGVLNFSEELSLGKLDSETKGKRFAEIVGKVTSVIPLGNHLVTAIEHDTETGMYDPTNDVFMHIIGSRKYGFVNSTSATMSYNFFSSIVPRLFGQMNTEVDIGYLRKLSMKEKLEYEKYKSIYEEINQLIRDNQIVFDEFYKINLPYYTEIDRLTKDQHGMIKRMFPIIPFINRK
jgi:hypothetical protein